MASEAEANGLAVNFEPDRLDQAPPDATIIVDKQGEALWRVRIDYLDQAAERQVVALRDETAIARIARAVVQVLCEANGKPMPIPKSNSKAVPTTDVHATLLAGSLTGVGESLRLHADEHAFVVRNRKGAVLLDIPADHVLDVVATRPEFDYYGLDTLVCGDAACAAGAVIYEAVALPIIIAKNTIRKNFLEITWQEDGRVKRAAFQLWPAGQVRKALNAGMAEKP
jgi:hypothetical protein